MGVDYSCTLGYGLTLEEIPDFISTEKWVDESEVNEWLEANGYKHIEFEPCGNWMSGEHVYLFYVKGTRQRLDPMYDEGVLAFEQPSLSNEVYGELINLCIALKLSWLTDVSWKLIFNVS